MKLFGRKKVREAAVQFDPETQYAVIRSSIWAAFLVLLSKK